MESSSPFDFITNSYEKIMLDTAYQAITSLELWDYMKKPTDSYMLNSDNELHRIMDEIVKLGYDGHSGGSFGYTMRAMQFIAKYGLDEYQQSKIAQV